MGYLLETRKLTKIFGDFIANKEVDFWCEGGKVISLLGENGAGKSTLMKTIYGMQSPDGGEIFYKGKQIHFKSPKEAMQCGIQMVHQHFMLIEEMTVAENITMGNEPKKWGLFDRQEASHRICQISDTYHFGINPEAKIYQLSVGEKQKVEIIKALYRGAEILILDEPTAVLTPQETEGLFQVIRQLKEDGKSIIIITHKLHETMEIADDIFVMRHGEMVGYVKKEETEAYKLTCMMIDHEPKKFQKYEYEPGDTALRLSNVFYGTKANTRILNSLSLEIHFGEIYGIAGIEGNGQTELVEAIAGIVRGWKGEINIFGKNIEGLHTKDIMNMGVAFVHPDRIDRGLLLKQDVGMNVILGNQYSELVTSGKRLDYGKVGTIAENIFKKYQVSPANPLLPLEKFSGGNQQKIIIGREFSRSPKLAILAHPTRGVDVGVCEIIHDSILELKKQGAAILLITADFDELFRLSDRIGVIYEGHIMTEGKAEEYTPTRLGLYMGGGSENEE